MNISNGEDQVHAEGILGNGTADGNRENETAPKEKRLGQLTFEDFEHIKHVETSPSMSGHAVGLRRSKRVHLPRFQRDPDEIAEEEAAAAAKDKRSKAAVRARAKAKEREKLAKEKEKQRAALLKKAAKENAKKSSANGKSGPIATESSVPTLTNGNWTPNMPLLSSDYKTHHSIISRLKNPNMKAVPYAGTIMKLMSFINKFSLYFAKELLNLSFQDFEIGLDLYPEDSLGISSINTEGSAHRTTLYQDFVPIKDIVSAQDKMNLLFLTLLKLTFSTSKSNELQKTHHPHATMNQLHSSKKIFAHLMKQLRAHAKDWGYPKEWKFETLDVEAFLKPKSQIFENDELEDPVDPKNGSILTKNLYTWHQQEIVPLESDPLYISELDRNGILALEPHDRVILFRSLLDWCSAQSPQIRNEIYHLSHFKRDPSFGIQTQHAPRYMVEGASITLAQFRKLCSMVQTKYEIRSKKKHVKKQIESGKRADLVKKFDFLKEIKAEMKKTPKEEKDQVMIALYDKWCGLFEGELQDNPLSDPFEDELYKLRQQEFFIGRVPQIGDFYLPRLHAYDSSPIASTYRDLRSLQELLRKFSDGTVDAFTLFENHGQEMSSQFKVIYHDTPSVVRDTVHGKYTANKNYWFEMCCDTVTLKEFLDFLEYKITPGDTVKVQDHNALNGQMSLDDNPEKELNGADSTTLPPHESDKENEKPSPDTNSNSLINKHPLPKEARFNAARTKLEYLKKFLTDMLPVLQTFETLKEQYSDMKPGKRLLRRAQTRSINYNASYDSDAENADLDMGEEFVDDEEDSEANSDEAEDANEQVVEEDEGEEMDETENQRGAKRARSERNNSRIAKKNRRS